MGNSDPRVIAYAGWSYLVEPGETIHSAVIEQFGAVEALEYLRSKTPIPGVGGIEMSALRRAERRWLERFNSLNAQANLDLLESLNGCFIPAFDERYPEGLMRLGPAQPLGLWCRGDQVLPSGPIVAVVGARCASSSGEAFTQQLVHALAPECSIISGGAYGIDYAAHRAAIEVGEPTWAVLAGGPDRLYPSGHFQLFNDILKSGGIITEMPPGARPSRWRFISRNRIIAALADVVIVVEAAYRSGALVTARAGFDIGVEVGAVPGHPSAVMSGGCNELIRNGATCITRPEDVLELIKPLTQISGGTYLADPVGEIGPGGNLDLDPRLLQRLEQCDALAKRVYMALPVSRGAKPARIAIAAGLTTAEVVAALKRLESKHLVEHRQGDWRRIDALV